MFLLILYSFLEKEVSFWHHGYILHKVPDIRSEEQKNVHK